MYLLPKPKTIKEQDGQMLLCHSTHIVMTKEVAETEMHAAKRLQEAIRQETGLILPFSVGDVQPTEPTIMCVSSAMPKYC